MDFQLERELARELRRDERLIWSGRPVSGLRLHTADAFLIPFSFLWATFAAYWEYSVIRDGASLFFVLWGVPFLLAGLYITAERFIFDAYRRSRLAYVLTNQRVLVIRNIWNRTVESHDLTGLSSVSVQEHRDGTATIALGPRNGMHAWFAQASWPGAGRYLPPMLECLADGR